MVPTPCNECNVYGYCSTSEAECQAYNEYFSWDGTDSQADCVKCQNSGYCTGSIEECEGFLGSISGASISTHHRSNNMPANKGLINWISGPITSIATGDYMALVSIQNGENLMTAMMPKSEFESLGYKQGDMITMAVKSVNVKILR